METMLPLQTGEESRRSKSADDDDDESPNDLSRIRCI